MMNNAMVQCKLNFFFPRIMLLIFDLITASDRLFKHFNLFCAFLISVVVMFDFNCICVPKALASSLSSSLVHFFLLIPEIKPINHYETLNTGN